MAKSRTMRAVVFKKEFEVRQTHTYFYASITPNHSPHFQVVVEDRPYPELQEPTDVVLKVTSAALCVSEPFRADGIDKKTQVSRVPTCTSIAAISNVAPISSAATSLLAKWSKRARMSRTLSSGTSWSCPSLLPASDATFVNVVCQAGALQESFSATRSPQTRSMGARLNTFEYRWQTRRAY